ncbi:hypothetical protein A3Q34_08615 [Colwellia sp. PAMC 20917]|uniref:hypothetical protein n=1 Tax=Colwellia sp. PAMC 20917 TaxID=1816218 RepID=UPI000878351D|nr:hypothetical protein [Colwellia sp. PAMC 20917]AOW76913.1 hypothetical protein A3Q34_08615 [Colwellia sp. PAMC 20917]
MKLINSILTVALLSIPSISLADEYKITNIDISRSLDCSGHFIEVPDDVILKHIGFIGKHCKIQLVHSKNISLSGKKVVIAQMESDVKNTYGGSSFTTSGINSIESYIIK